MTQTRGRIDYGSLVDLDNGLVHSDVYADPEVFEEEIEKIFHRGWVYVGHDSEIPQPGDYALKTIGRQSVIMCRDDQGEIRLFMNRCMHRANAVCQYDEGNASFFRCAYHGWTYKNSGELIGIPFSDNAYREDFRKEDHGLTAVPRQDIYRGFVWGSLSPGEMTLAEHLGEPTLRMIDHFCNASPEGEVILRQGHTKVVYEGNWKFQGGDGYHPTMVHQSAFGVVAKRAGVPYESMFGSYREGSTKDGVYSRDLGNGHYALDSRAAMRSRLPDTEWAKEYHEAMVKQYGKEEGEYLINTGGDPHAMIMPNFQLLNDQVRVIFPVSVDRSIAWFFPAALKGAPKELNVRRLRAHERSQGPAGSVNTDDVEMFERNQFGMRQEVDPWQVIARGLNREFRDTDGTMASDMTDETTQRSQLSWWVDVMSRA